MKKQTYIRLVFPKKMKERWQPGGVSSCRLLSIPIPNLNIRVCSFIEYLTR